MLLQNKRFWKLESIFLLIAALLFCGCKYQKSPVCAASRHSEDDSIDAFFKDFYAGYDTLYHRYVAYDISTDERLHRARQLEFFLMEYCHDDIINEYHSVEIIRKDGKLKIYAIGRHPIMFSCDTQTIE